MFSCQVVYRHPPWYFAVSTETSSAISWNNNMVRGGLPCHQDSWHPDIFLSTSTHARQAWFICKQEQLVWAITETQRLSILYVSKLMTTSCNGNVFHVPAPLWGDSTGHRWISLTKGQERGLRCFFGVSLNKRLSKRSSAGGLRRHGGHCEVTVMYWHSRSFTMHITTYNCIPMHIPFKCLTHPLQGSEYSGQTVPI